MPTTFWERPPSATVWRSRCAGQPTECSWRSSPPVARAASDFWQAFEDAENRRVAGPGSRLVVLTKGSDQESPAAVAALVGVDFETVMSTEAFDDYSVPIAPYFVLIDSGRVIGEGAAASFDQLQSLMSKALTDAGFGMGSRRSRRDMLRGRRQPTVDEALEAAGIGPGHPSLHSDPSPEATDGTPGGRGA